MSALSGLVEESIARRYAGILLFPGCRGLVLGDYGLRTPRHTTIPATGHSWGKLVTLCGRCRMRERGAGRR